MIARRLVVLLAGLFLYGFTMAMLVESTLGLDPWDVFHEGVANRVPLTFGQVVIVTGAAVLLLWIPLRQRPGIGTVLNVVIIGLAADFGIWLIDQPDHLFWRTMLLVGGVVGNGFAGALYISANLGSGPRDGLWLALVRLTGRSIRFWRTSIEITVLAIGFALGGTVGVGTVLYALAIGPLVQLFTGLLPDRTPDARRAEIERSSAARGDEQGGVRVDQHLDGGEAVVGEPPLTDRVDLTVDDRGPER